VTKKRSDVPVFLLYAGIIHAIGLALFLPVLITFPGPGRESTPAPKTSPVDVLVLPAAQPLTDIGPEQTSALPAAPSVEEGKAEGAAAPVAADAKIGQEPKDNIEVVAPAAESEAKPAPLEAEPREKAPEAEATVGDGGEGSRGGKDAVANVGPEAETQAEPVPQQTEPPAAKPSPAPEADKPAKQKPEARKTPEAKASTKVAAPVKAAPRTAKTSSARRSTAKRAPGRTASRTAKSQTKFAPFSGVLSGVFAPPANKRR
jgi:hypothetical protein